MHIADIQCKLNELLWDKHEDHYLSAKATIHDYTYFGIKSRTLDGMRYIKKAMSLSEVRTFEFRESYTMWKGALSLEEKIENLEDKITDLERDVNPREKSFDHSSSFVGQVVYTPDTNSMEINLNRKTYGFCGVPERIFESFEAAPSKGAYFTRSIKGQFNC